MVVAVRLREALTHVRGDNRRIVVDKRNSADKRIYRSKNNCC